jgi:hypothetical protein
MNEQIKAIGRQAGLVFIEDGVYGQRWYSSKCGLDASEYEKLVGLIVKECAEVSNQAEKQCQHPGTMIKQHFGVEE